MPRKQHRSPQEKKALSLAKDCRNTYGENDKASRKAIPLRKAMENRQDRRKIAQDMDRLPLLPEDVADVVESSARHEINRVGGWTKGSDEPLGKVVAQARLKREWRDGRKERERSRRSAPLTTP